jgi:hypothetical protein
MKKTVFAFMALLFVVAEAAHAQSNKGVIPNMKAPAPPVLDCRPLRTGTFKTTIKGKTTVMERTATTESDYLDGAVVPVIYKIKWTGDCSYTLTPTPQTLKLHPEIRKDAVFTVETYLKNTYSYTQVLSANYSKAKTNIEVYKVK